MAASQFIRTVVFGGYNRSDVDKRLDSLYDMCFDYRNKLRESKLIVDKLKSGSTDQEAINSALADDRAKLTEQQVKNQNLVDKARSIADELERKKQEADSLRAELDSIKVQLNEANARLASENGTNSGAMLNVVFQQAQTSADLILNTAKKQASDLESDSKKLAENIITDANNKAKMIIYNAETEAAGIIKEAKEKSAAMDVASGNLKASILSDAEKMNEAFTNFKSVFDKFATSGSSTIERAQSFLSGAISDLNSGGTPIFREPEAIADDLVEMPQFDDIDDSYLTNGDTSGETAEKKNDVLQKLQEKAEMMNGGNKQAEDNKKSGKKKVSLDELTKRAESMK